MDSITLFGELRARLSRSLGHAMKQILKARKAPEPLRANAMDIFAASGYLLRASSAFVGSLSDYIEHRALMGDAKGTVVEGKLKNTAEYFQDAVDTFISTVDALSPEPKDQQPSSGQDDGSPDERDGEAGTTCLERVLYSGSPALDRYRVILADARQNHDVLRHSVVDLRKHIKLTFGLAESVSS